MLQCLNSSNLPSSLPCLMWTRPECFLMKPPRYCVINRWAELAGLIPGQVCWQLVAYPHQDLQKAISAPCTLHQLRVPLYTQGDCKKLRPFRGCYTLSSALAKVQPLTRLFSLITQTKAQMQAKQCSNAPLCLVKYERLLIAVLLGAFVR